MVLHPSVVTIAVRIVAKAVVHLVAETVATNAAMDAREDLMALETEVMVSPVLGEETTVTDRCDLS